MQIEMVELAALEARHLADAARILREALAHMPSAYGAAGAAEAEVEQLLADPDYLGIAALERGRLIGWTGALRTYSHGWELHPLVVDPPHQRQGVGARLVDCIEARARSAGVLTLYVGSDDDWGGTSLYGRELFPGVLAHAAAIEDARTAHAIGFYRRCGFELVGVLPDVNGKGMPDLLLAKSLRRG